MRSNLRGWIRAAALGTAVVSVISLAGESTADAKPKKDPAPAAAAFDRDAALQSLLAVDLSKCKVPGGPRGDGHVVVAFATTGKADSASVDKGPFLGVSKVQRCIEGKFKSASVPAFTGDPVSVGKNFQLQ
jgi:hypothetical protein